MCDFYKHSNCKSAGDVNPKSRVSRPGLADQDPGLESDRGSRKITLAGSARATPESPARHARAGDRGCGLLGRLLARYQPRGAATAPGADHVADQRQYEDHVRVPWSGLPGMAQRYAPVRELSSAWRPILILHPRVESIPHRPPLTRRASGAFRGRRSNGRGTRFRKQLPTWIPAASRVRRAWR